MMRLLLLQIISLIFKIKKVDIELNEDLRVVDDNVQSMDSSLIV